MNEALHREVLDRLASYKFKTKSGWLQKGVCPACHEKELYAKADAPWVLRCGRLNKCGYEGYIKDLFPEIFEDWSKRCREEQKTNRNAAADGFLSFERGFNLDRIKGWYSQELYRNDEADNGRGAISATVRFSVGTGYWERLIDRVYRFKGKAHFKWGASFQGMWWQPPGRDLARATKIWITEGIFNAIALDHHDISAASSMSANNYPGAALQALAEECKSRGLPRPKLVWALDTDKAGGTYTIRWVAQARKDGWECEAAQVPPRSGRQPDWNDLHLSNRLDERTLNECLYHGALLIAPSAMEKALLIYRHDGRSEFHLSYDNALFWFRLDLAEFHKAVQELEKEGRDAAEDKEKNTHQALLQAHTLTPIANCVPVPLYYLANEVTDEAWYLFSIVQQRGGPALKALFTASQMASATDFNKRLLHVAPGAMYSGTSTMLRRMLEQQLAQIQRVQTIDYIGYSREHGCYVFNQVAVKDSKACALNSEDYFDFGKLSLKSLSQSVQLAINRDLGEYSEEWVQLLWTAFGSRGLVGLAFWFGSLFAEQIRATQKSMPFLEVVGEAGSGKTTLMEFMWKLLGRADYEGIDIQKATAAGRNRALVQVSNLPTVLIESDRSGNGSDKGPHNKGFDWDELKPMFNGRGVRARGVANGGNETKEPPFRSSIVIAQNAAVAASDAILQRIVHVHFDKAGHSAEGLAASRALENMPMERVSGFLLKAVLAERDVLKKIAEATPVHEKRLLQTVKTVRLAKNHAQLCAMADALRLVVRLTDQQHAQLLQRIDGMAVERQEAINADHPLVDEFWEAFEYLDQGNTRLNHSAKPLEEICVNLNHFLEVARAHGQAVPLLGDLKKVLPMSKRYPYDKQNVVRSAIKDGGPVPVAKTLWCWVFKRPAKNGHRTH